MLIKFPTCENQQTQPVNIFQIRLFKIAILSIELVFSNIRAHTNMKSLYLLFLLVCLAAIATAYIKEEEDEMMLSKGFFEIVSEIHDKLRQLSKYNKNLSYVHYYPDTVQLARSLVAVKGVGRSFQSAYKAWKAFHYDSSQLTVQYTLLAH